MKKETNAPEELEEIIKPDYFAEAFDLNKKEVKEVIEEAKSKSLFSDLIEPSLRLREEYRQKVEELKKRMPEDAWETKEYQIYHVLKGIPSSISFLVAVERGYYAYQRWQEKYGEARVQRKKPKPGTLSVKRGIGPDLNYYYGHYTSMLTIGANKLQKESKKDLMERSIEAAIRFEDVTDERCYIEKNYLFKEEAKKFLEEVQLKEIEEARSAGKNFVDPEEGRKMAEKRMFRANIEPSLVRNHVEFVKEVGKQRGIPYEGYLTEVFSFMDKETSKWARTHRKELAEYRKEKLQVTKEFLGAFRDLVEDYLIKVENQKER